MKKTFLKSLALLVLMLCSTLTWAAEASLPSGTILYFCMSDGEHDWTADNAAIVINFYDADGYKDHVQATKIGTTKYYQVEIPATCTKGASSFQIIRRDPNHVWDDGDGFQWNYSASQSAVSRTSESQNCLTVAGWNDSQPIWSVYNPFEIQGNWTDWAMVDMVVVETAINTYKYMTTMSGDNKQFAIHKKVSDNYFKFSSVDTKTSSSNISITSSDATWDNLTFSLPSECDVEIIFTYASATSVHVEATASGEEPEPLPGVELTSGGHSIFYTAYKYGASDYEFTIRSSESLSGLGGSFWNVNGVGTDMRNSMTRVDEHTLRFSVTSTSVPNIYTPLYILMPGEVNFGSVTIDWIEKNPVATASSGTGIQAPLTAGHGTRWESAQTDTEWWMVDYQRPVEFNAIHIDWEGAYSEQFTLEGSNDGENFTVLYTESNQTSAGEHNYELDHNVSYRYVKINITKRATGWGNSFFEFTTYVAVTPILTTLTMSAAKPYTAIGSTLR